MQTKTIIRILKVIVWISGLYFSSKYNFHVIYFIISGLYLMFTNMGKREKGTLSAYSVFNQNFERLHGTMDPTQLFKSGEKQKAKLVIQTKKEPRQQPNANKQEYFKNQSKYSNKPCFCGSSLKFKKCCLPAQRNRIQQQRRQRHQQQRIRKTKAN